MSTLLQTSEQTPVQPSGADPEAEPAPLEVAFETRGLGVSYSGTRAVADVDLDIPRGAITAFIGPSGCGKTTVLRCLNRMNDLIVGARVTGHVHYRGVDLHDHSIDPVAVRRRIGMVFQKPNPFPMSIRDNVAFGRKLAGRVPRRELDDVVERSLGQAGLWSEVKDRLGENAMALSGGQQQRMCIARALAVDPEVVLMDEPCSALDPIATEHIEELLTGLVEDFTIVIVTHNMHQAARIADITAFFTTEEDAEGNRVGRLVEVGPTGSVFHSPQDQRTADYVGGRFG